MGAEGKYDLKLAPGYDPESPQVANVTSTVTSSTSNAAATSAPPSSVTTISTAVRSTKVRETENVLCFVDSLIFVAENYNEKLSVVK